MMSKEKEVTAEKDLVIERDILDEANLGKNLSLIIQEGEIHIVPINPFSMLKRPWKS